MSSIPEDSEDPVLSPDDAFGVLGNETRMEILRTLSGADEPLGFADLFDRVAYDESSNFSYHLERLVGHFVEKTGDGYILRETGQRIIQAVLSGAVTESPTVELMELDERCYHCGSQQLMDYRDHSAFIYCPGCSGNVDVPEDVLVRRLGSAELASELGVKSTNPFPPSLVQGRSATEIRHAGTVRFHLDMFSWGTDLCPRCTATLDPSVAVCRTHGPAEGVCETCGNRQAIMFETTCTNCTYSKRGLFSYRLFCTHPMLDFLTDHGLNPVAPSFPEEFWGNVTPYEEEVLSADPFGARFTFTIEQEALTLTVDDDLHVVNATRQDVSEDNCV